MKIVFLSDDFPPQSFGGAGISTYELALGMKKTGQEVFAITTCRNKSEAGESDYNGITVFNIASNYDKRFRAYISINNRPVVRRVEEILKKIQPDVVHANNIHFYLSYRCLKTAKKYARTIVFTARDTMSFSYGKLGTRRYLEQFDPRVTWRDNLKEAGKRWNPFRNFFIRRYLKYVDGIFAISKSLQGALLQNGIQNVEVVYNGINADEWNVAQETVDDFRIKYQLRDKRTLFFNGRLSATKGGAKVVEALAMVVKEIPDTILLVAGSVDQYAEQMKKKAKELGVEAHLVFTGWLERSDIKVAYAVSDVVLMSSVYLDAFGRVNIEAMASKKPVIGTCYGGTPEIVVDGETGYIVNPLYPQKIAEKCIDLLKNPEKARQFGEAGDERAKSNFNLSEKVNEYIRWYEHLCGRKEG